MLPDGTEFAAYLFKGSHRPVDLLGGMGGRNLNPDAGLSFGHYGIEETGYVDAFFQQALCHFLRQGSVVQHHRDDARIALFDIQSDAADAFLETPSVGFRAVAQRGIGHDHFEGLCSRSDGNVGAGSR